MILGSLVNKGGGAIWSLGKTILILIMNEIFIWGLKSYEQNGYGDDLDIN